MFDLDTDELKTAFYRRLSDTQCRKLHDAGLQILERTGVRMHDEEAVALLRQGGAHVSDGDRVHIPAWRVEWALRTAPKHVVLYDQAGEPALRLGGRKVYYGNGSDLLNTLDRHTGERRRAVLKDLVQGMQVLGSLPNIDFVMSYVFPDDVEPEKGELYQMRAMLEHTSKPVAYVATSFERTLAAVEMCEAAAGGAEAFRERPFAACYINITTPLRHNPESVQKLMWLAGEGLPFIYFPALITRGLATPITPAGHVALNNASQLAGLVLSQLVREGAPFIRCSCAGNTFDMRNMVGQHAGPEARGFNSDLANWYGLPSFGMGAVTGSKTLDEQAGLEAALTLLLASLSGEQMIHDVGYMENGLTASLQQLVICDELIDWVRYYLRGLEINEDTLALDVIHEVGPDGQFMEMEHTARHCRDDWYPELFDRNGYDRWAEEGGLTLQDRARERVDEILDGYVPKPIPDRVKGAWDGIADR